MRCRGGDSARNWIIVRSFWESSHMLKVDVLTEGGQKIVTLLGNGNADVLKTTLIIDGIDNTEIAIARMQSR